SGGGARGGPAARREVALDAPPVGALGAARRGRDRVLPTDPLWGPLGPSGGVAFARRGRGARGRHGRAPETGRCAVLVARVRLCVRRGGQSRSSRLADRRRAGGR